MKKIDIFTKKGYIFTLDMLFAFFIVTTVIVTFSVLAKQTPNSANELTLLAYSANDALDILKDEKILETMDINEISQRLSKLMKNETQMSMNVSKFDYDNNLIEYSALENEPRKGAARLTGKYAFMTVNDGGIENFYMIKYKIWRKRII